MSRVDLIKFKDELISELVPVKWNPTDEQLVLIAKKITEIPVSQEKDTTKSDLQLIINEVCGRQQWYTAEGVDHSEVLYLLQLARKIKVNK